MVFKKGEVGYWTGKKREKPTSETAEKISAALRGIKRSPETIRKMSICKTGERNGMWKGGRTLDHNGYFQILSSTHPFRNSANRVAEHRLVMERHLGRYLLPSEIVHHINNDRTDNRIENLMLFSSKSEHGKHHYPGGIKK